MAVTVGVIFSLFGVGLLFWCAVELRLRSRLRRTGTTAVARVIADRDLYGVEDPAPALTYRAAGHADAVVARPRGHTPLRRSPQLSPGTLVQVAYDPARLDTVALAEGLRTGAIDVFWTILGLAGLAAGLAVLASAVVGRA
jgi:hypothetical protein